MSDPKVDLSDTSTEDLEDELIHRAGDFMVTASEKITEAVSLVVRKDYDAEGPLADAIQHLTTALTIVRTLKKESTHVAS